MLSPLQSASPRYPEYTTSLVRHASTEEQQNSPLYSYRENSKSLKMRTPSSNNVYTSYNSRPRTNYLNHEDRGLNSRGGRLHSQQVFDLRRVYVGSPKRAKSIAQINLTSPRQGNSVYSVFNQQLLNTDYYLYDQQGQHERKNMFQNLHTCLSSKRMKTLNDDQHHPNINGKYLPNLHMNTTREIRTASNIENLATLNSHRSAPPLADIKLTTSRIIISSPRQNVENRGFSRAQKRPNTQSMSKKVGDSGANSYLNNQRVANSELNSWHETDEVSNNNNKNVSTSPSNPNGSPRSTPNKFRISTLPS